MADLSYLNIYSGNKTPQKGINAALAGCAITGFGESKNIIDNLRKLPDYDLIKGSGAADPRSVKDSVLAVRCDLRSLGQGAIALNSKAAPEKIAPERWGVYTLNQVRGIGKLSVINGHNHAAVQGRDKDLKRVQEYITFMQNLALLSRTFKQMGFANVIMGDLNWREDGKQMMWSPVKMFNRIGYDYICTNVDYIAWDASMLRCPSHTILKKSDTGSNHEGIRATIRKKRG